MRGLMLALGALAVAYAATSFWINQGGGFAGHPRWCEWGLCNAELLEQEAKLQRIAGRSQRAMEFEIGLLERNAASPFTWAHAGEGYQASGDPARARDCAARSLQLGSSVAAAQMQVLNYYVGEDDREHVLSTGRRLLSLVRQYDDFVFRYYDAVEASVETVLARGLPDQSDAAISYLEHLIGKPDQVGAERTWAWMRSRSLGDDATANSYAGFLLRCGSIEKAWGAWNSYFHDAERLRGPSLVRNGGFEAELSGGVFDWRVTPVEGAEARLDAGCRHSGTRALRIDFAGTHNLEYRHVAQRVLAVPGSRLRLRAWVRTENLTTNEGVAIEVADMEHGAFRVQTEPVTGTTEWRRLECTFLLPKGVRLLELEVLRKPSWKLDNKIQGTVWLDDITLEGGS